MMPPHGLPCGSMGRRDNKLIHIYKEQCNQKVSDSSRQKLADNMYVSLFRGLSLKEYTIVHNADRQNRHKQPCSGCAALLLVANYVVREGHITLSKAFKMAFQSQAYKADIAKQRMLQMPLACVRVGTPESGKAVSFLVEFIEGVNYINFAHLAEVLFGSRALSLTAQVLTELRSNLSLD